MAQTSDNVITRATSGSIGKQVTFRQRGGKTVMSKYPKIPTGNATVKQEAVRSRFLTSVRYAKGAISVPDLKEAYLSVAKPGQSAFNVAFSDAYNAPEVSKIDVSKFLGAVGDSILIIATDDFKVNDVSVSILDAAGAVLEQGKAVLQENVNEWLYKATIAHAVIAGLTVRAIATDLPGNSGSADIVLQ